ncbi:hypothetical protein HQ584_12695 [Patescibacteria group bacterium]|nr:hypothetical protein [Patescibacteria group bacterium]
MDLIKKLLIGSNKKKLKREQLRDNVRKGKVGEEEARFNYALDGYKVKRTGRGHDFKVEKVDILTGRKEKGFVEVKTGKSKLSKLQKKTKKRKGKKYKVCRRNPLIY